MRRSRKASNRSHTTSISRLLNAARADAAATECTVYLWSDPKCRFLRSANPAPTIKGVTPTAAKVAPGDQPMVERSPKWAQERKTLFNVLTKWPQEIKMLLNVRTG